MRAMGYGALRALLRALVAQGAANFISLLWKTAQEVRVKWSRDVTNVD